MGYKQDVLGVQVGATIWMCYENDVLGCQVGATKKIGYEKDVLENNCKNHQEDVTLNTQELLSLKSNIFEHIFYEFNMYFSTYSYLVQFTQFNITSQPDDGFWVNVLYESHATHLRNLIHFFSGTDSINAKTVLIENPKLGITDNNKKTKVIDRAISHLTIERKELAGSGDDLTIAIDKVIKEMYPIIRDRIKTYLNILYNVSSIKPEYLDDFQHEEIQNRYNNLLSSLK